MAFSCSDIANCCGYLSGHVTKSKKWVQHYAFLSVFMRKHVKS